MYSASDLKKGLKIEMEGSPYIITEFTFSKPGKGQSIYNCKLKNMINGSTMSKSFRSNDKMKKPHLMEKSLMYSYCDGDHYIFMDENYEQISLDESVLGNKRYFLVEDVNVDVLMFNDQPIDVVLPNFVEKKVIHTEPGARGNTATNVLKPATVEGGLEVQVPIFINNDEIIKIDTRTGSYADRVKK